MNLIRPNIYWLASIFITVKYIYFDTIPYIYINCNINNKLQPLPWCMCDSERPREKFWPISISWSWPLSIFPAWTSISFPSPLPPTVPSVSSWFFLLGGSVKWHRFSKFSYTAFFCNAFHLSIPPSSSGPFSSSFEPLTAVTEAVFLRSPLVLFKGPLGVGS